MPTTPSPTPHLTLPFGRFYGCTAVQRSAPGLAWSMMRADPHRIVTRHSHEEAHFVLVLDGLYVSSAEGAPAVSDGVQLIYNPPGTTHRDRFEARDRVIEGQFLTLSVAHEWLVELLRSRTEILPTSATVVSDPSTLRVARRLAVACANHACEAAFDQHALALDLLEVFSHEVKLARRDPADAPSWLIRVRDYLNDSIGGQVSMSEVAREAGVHPVHVARVFRRYTGRDFLVGDRYSLADIALACGFADQSHFSHAFRRACGSTPREYRSAHTSSQMNTFSFA